MINIIDNEFNYLGLVDDYKSFIATKDYHSIGSFELHLNAKNTNAEYLQKENIIFTDEDNAFIILYRYANTVDDSLVIKGLQLKSYLARWIIFPSEGEEHLKLKSNIESVMKLFVQSTLNRKGITNIVIADNQNRGSVISYQSRYKNLAEELEKISVVSGAGWNIKLDLENKQFIFDIEIGKDRTVEQSINTQAIFSTEYDNISEQELIESRLDYANKAIVAGQGEGVNRTIKVVGDSEGLESYELFVDARDLEDEDELPDRGLQKLSEVAEVISFDSKVIPNSNLVYKKDFDLGDMVTNQNKDWDIRVNRRIVGITEIYEEDGFNLEVLFGNSLPTIMDKIKRLEDKPIWEGGAGSGGNNYQLGNVKNLRVEEDDKSIELFWEDPSNIEIEGMEGTIYTLARWDGTRVVRKKDSFPINENDGILVIDSKTHNQFKDVGFIDTGLENEVEYYYKLFPYTEFGIFTVDEANRASATPTEIKIYGVEIDESNSNPETSVVYTDDAIGFISASGNNGAFSWGSWENVIKEEFGIRPVVLENLGGGNAEVNYPLQYDDYTKKADGSNSDLTGIDGDVMIEFGQELWWKFSRVGSKLKIQLSAKYFDGAVNHAFDIEEGYNQFSFYPLTLTQIIMLLMLKNRDTQTALGRGYVDRNSAYLNTGQSNSRPFMYGETTGKQQVKFLGMEDYWGNRRQWIDGCFYDANRNMMIGKSNFNDTGAGYMNNGAAMSAGDGGYVDAVQGGDNTGFIPKSFAGSATTHYSDYSHLYGGGLPYFGGHRSEGDYAGGFYLHSNTAASASAYIGGRLSLYFGGKLYLGVYLGSTVSGKLRSVSGQVSENDKTVGAFRTLAKANN